MIDGEIWDSCVEVVVEVVILWWGWEMRIWMMDGIWDVEGCE